MGFPKFSEHDKSFENKIHVLPKGIFRLSNNERKNPEEWVSENDSIDIISYQKEEISNSVCYVLVSNDKRVGQVSFKKNNNNLYVENIYIGEDKFKD